MATFVPARGPDGKILLGPLGSAAEDAGATSPPSPVPPPRALSELLPRPPAAVATPAPQLVPRHAFALTTVGGIVVLVVVAWLGSLTSRPTTPPPVAAAPPAPATATPTAAPPPPQLARAVVAYAAPDGVAIGALEPGRPYAVVGRVGATWLQIVAGDSGRVWVRRAELAPGPAAQATAAALPDLATPTPTPVLPTVYVPPPTQPPPMRCLATEYGERCEYGLDPQDRAVATEIARASREYSAAWRAAWQATATAAAK